MNQAVKADAAVLVEEVAKPRIAISRLAVDPKAWVALAVFTGVSLRLFRLGDAPLWLDETITARWIALPWHEMLRHFLVDNHPPLYFVILKLWVGLVGNAPWALRLPGVIFSALAVPLIGVSAGLVVGRKAIPWAAWLAALNPYFIQHAQEARMYSLLLLFAAIHLYLLLRLVRNESAGLGWIFVVTAAGFVLTHFYAVFFICGELAILLILRPKPFRRWLTAALATAAITLGSVGLAALLGQHHAGASYNIGLFAVLGSAWAILAGYALLPSSADVHAVGLEAARQFVPLALVGGVALIVIVIAAVRVLDRTALTLAVIVLGATAVGPIVVSALYPVAMNPRYFIAGAPLLIIGIAAGASRWRLLGLFERGAVAVLVVTMLVGSGLHLAQPGHGREDVRAAGAWLDANVPKDEEILLTSADMLDFARFQWPDRHFRLYPLQPGVINQVEAERLAGSLPFPDGDRVVYIFGMVWDSDASGALQQALTVRYSQCTGTVVRGIRIMCLVRPNRAGQASQSPSEQVSHAGLLREADAMLELRIELGGKRLEA